VLERHAVGDPSEPLDLDALRVAQDSVAVFEIATAETTVRMCLAGRRASESLTRTFTWSTEDVAATADVGVRAVEMLRAGLREYGLSFDDLSQPESEPSGSRVAVGLQGAFGSFTSSPLTGLSVSGQVALPSRVFVLVSGVLPVGLKPSYEAQAGRSTFSTWWGGIGVGGWLADPSWGWQPDLAAGVSLSALLLSYEPATAEYVGEDLWTVRPAPFLELGVSSPRVGPIAGRGVVRGEWMYPIDIALDEQPVGTWGPALVGVGFGLDVVL